MKKITLFFIFISLLGVINAQNTYQVKKKRSEYFGSKKITQEKESRKTDKVRPWGLYIQAGPTLNKANDSQNFTFNRTDNSILETIITPDSKWGIGAEFGLLRFNVKEPKLAFGRIVDYFDFGVSFRAFNGAESTIVDSISPLGVKTPNYLQGVGELKNIYGTFRFGVHKLQYLTKTKNYFINHGLGLTANLALSNNRNYKGFYTAETQNFQNNFNMQLHYDVGLGFRLARGKYLIPGIELPLLGMSNGEFGNPKINWFSSEYYPMFIKVKYIQLFKAKLQKTGCFIGSEEDRKRDQKMRQGM